MGPYPAGYPESSAGGTDQHIPVSRRVSAAGICFSVILFPPRGWALLRFGLPDLSPDLDGVPVFRTRELQPGWVPSLPRGRRCSTRSSRVLDRRLPLFGGQSFHPRHQQSIDEGPITRHQRGFTRCGSPHWLPY